MYLSDSGAKWGCKNGRAQEQSELRSEGFTTSLVGLTASISVVRKQEDC